MSPVIIPCKQLELGAVSFWDPTSSEMTATKKAAECFHRKPSSSNKLQTKLETAIHYSRQCCKLFTRFQKQGTCPGSMYDKSAIRDSSLVFASSQRCFRKRHGRLLLHSDSALVMSSTGWFVLVICLLL